MYCPKCSTQNIDSAKFCRTCGANLSLVPQALTGRLPEAQDANLDRRGRRRREPSIGRGVTRVFMGIAFLLVAAGITFSGRGTGGSGLWLLIPAFIFLGKGIGELVTLLNAERSSRQITPPLHAQSTSPLPPHPVLDPLSPPSVTEETTRHLDTARKKNQETR
jgi:zinc-ribbon domain